MITIESKEKCSFVDFGSLEHGETFYYNEEVYIKTNFGTKFDNDCVKLTTGEIFNLDNNTNVIPRDFVMQEVD